MLFAASEIGDFHVFKFFEADGDLAEVNGFAVEAEGGWFAEGLHLQVDVGHAAFRREVWFEGALQKPFA